MEDQVGMKTTLFGGPPEIGNVVELANGQIGFMNAFAQPLFANMTDIFPAMRFAPAEILENKKVWTEKIEEQRRRPPPRNEVPSTDGEVSPRSQSPEGRKARKGHKAQSSSVGYFPVSFLQHPNPPAPPQQRSKSIDDSAAMRNSQATTTSDPRNDQSEGPLRKSMLVDAGSTATSSITPPAMEDTSTSSGASPSPRSEGQRPEVQTRRSSNTLPRSLQVNGVYSVHDQNGTVTMVSSESAHDGERAKSEGRSTRGYATTSLPMIFSDSVSRLTTSQDLPREDFSGKEVVSQVTPLASLPGAYQAQRRTQPQGQAHNRNGGRVAPPWTSDWTSMTGSGSEAYSNHYSATLVPPTEARSFLSGESSDEHLSEHISRDRWNTRSSRRDADHGRAKSTPITLSPLAPPNMAGHLSPNVGAGRRGTRKKSPALKSDPRVRLQQGRSGSVSTWGDGADGDRSLRRRISRLRFWRRKPDYE
jgi:hypothetical protein